MRSPFINSVISQKGYNIQPLCFCMYHSFENELMC